MKERGPIAIKAKPPRRRGLTLIETATALGVVSLVLAGFAQTVSTTSEQVRARGTAERLKEVSKAAQQYIDAYSPQILRNATVAAGGNLVIPIGRSVAGGAVPAGPSAELPSVQGAGLLYSDFIDVNPYGQRHSLVVKRGTQGTGRVEGMIITQGGSPIPDRTLGNVATLTGAQGGFVMQTPLAGLAGQIIGTRGGWQASTGSWSSGAVVPTGGRVMSIVGLNDTSLSGPYLARLDIGDPEQNTMRVDLRMGKNHIWDASSLCADGAANPTCSGTGTVEVGPNIHASANVRADQNVEAQANVSAGQNVFANQSVVAGQDVIALRDTYAGRNSTVVGNLAVAGQADIVGNVFGGAYYDHIDNRYYMQPGATTNLNDLRSQTLSLDTRVYGTQAGRYTAAAYRLGDLLPRYVLHEGYSASSSEPNVAKPNCGPGGQPKIILQPMADSMQFRANITYTQGLFGLESASDTPTNVTREYSALDYGSYWQVQLTGTSQMDGYVWRSVALTYCWYP